MVTMETSINLWHNTPKQNLLGRLEAVQSSQRLLAIKNDNLLLLVLGLGFIFLLFVVQHIVVHLNLFKNT